MHSSIAFPSATVWLMNHMGLETSGRHFLRSISEMILEIIVPGVGLKHEDAALIADSRQLRGNLHGLTHVVDL